MPRKKSAAKAPPTPRTPRPFVGRLDSIRSCRLEGARLYRAARKKVGTELSVDDAYKLGLLVTSVAKLVESGELEARIAEVERRLEATAPLGPRRVSQAAG